MYSVGFKLFFQRWENNQFQGAAFFDADLCITAFSYVKGYLLLGDVRKGIKFVQWKEEASSQSRTLRRLSRSAPGQLLSVLACEFVTHQRSLGLVALDHTGNVHLFQYLANSDGREGDQLLRSCGIFAMGSECRAVLRAETEKGIHCMFMASRSGSLGCLKPIDDQVYRTITTLLGMVTTRLPFRCGQNPRAFRQPDIPQIAGAPRKNIEDGVLLRSFAFLSGPIQASVADKMKVPLADLMRMVVPCCTCQLFSARSQGR